MSEIKEKQMPRFAIIDGVDAPCRNNVAEWVEGLGYCYMMRATDKTRKRFDGMNPERPTALSAFGFAAHVGPEEVIFKLSGVSTAVYADGSPRKWQDAASGKEFTLPRVAISKYRRAALRKGR